MLTKKVKNRILFLGTFLTIILISIFFILKTLNNNLLYFKTPSDVQKSNDTLSGNYMKIGGMVKKNSIKVDNEKIRFIITDYNNEIFVSYSGTVPNLFLEEKGVIAEGVLKDKKYFEATRILAKHDENYMPPELTNIKKNDVK
jgi:cytochrome c-type biogenesis protein CcmE|tara:strand:+ start:386 stop:814 length:429 start_codon:yes stop_codon:yes gene_type:complete